MKAVYYLVALKKQKITGLRKRVRFIFFIFIFVSTHSGLFAQKQKPKNESWYDEKLLHFGFSLGFNTMDF